MTPPYALVIPAYNAADTLADALRSALDQTWAPTRILVVDDGSSDGTHELAAAFGGVVEVMRQPNQGCASATNAGLARVETEFVAFLDADDLWLPPKAEQQLRFLADNPAADGVFGRVQVFKGPPAAPQRLGVADNWGRTTLMIRTASARRIGPLRVDLPGNIGDVIDWIARGRDLGMRFQSIKEIVAMRRVRPGSMSYGLDAEKARGYVHAVRRALDRKRDLASSADMADPPKNKAN